MDPQPEIFDISSDEEEEDIVASQDNYDWISEFLEDDSEDVVVLSELSSNPKSKSKSNTNDLDDDCVVLDGDPDKPVEIQTHNSDSDDLLVVGETGQVACRDYPHARHLCAKYPFSTTSHESHCAQCHCYVCDSVAPCIHWGLGLSNIDHCHATDKEEYWIIQRKCLKNCDQSPLSVPKAAHAISPSIGLPKRNQDSLSTPLVPNYRPHVFRPSSVRMCPASTALNHYTNINQGRSPQSGYVVPKNKFQPYLVPQQLPGTRCNINRHTNGDLGPRVNPPHAAFKRTLPTGVTLPNNRPRYSMPNTNYASHFPQNPHPVATTPTQRNPTMPQSNRHLPPNMGRIVADSVASQAQVSSQSNVGRFVGNSVPSLPQESSQVSTAFRFVTQFLMSSQPEVSSEPVNSVPKVSANSPFADSSSSQPQTYNQNVPLSDSSQTHFQQGNQSQSASNLGSADFDLSWVNPSGKSNQEPSAETSRHEGVAPIYDTSPELEFPRELMRSDPYEHGLFDLEYDSWLPDNQQFDL